MPTATLEEYLEAIYKLSREGPARPTRVAEALGVSGPTVTATLRRLKEQGLVRRPKGGVVLTDAGVRHALSIVRRHRLAERFLVDTLGLSWDEVHEEACLLEHAMSPKVQAALERFLEDPQRCPHGHPIPSEDLEISEPLGLVLTEVPAGSRVEISSVSEEDSVLLTHLGALGLFPGTVVTVVEASPFGGPVELRVGRETVSVGREAAAHVTVVEAPEDSGGETRG